MCPTSLGRNMEGLDWGRCNSECSLASYSSNTQVYEEIVSLSQSSPSISLPFIIGESELETPLIGIRITAGVRQPRESLKPMVRLVGNIHGNEAVGREIIMAFARHLIRGYGLEPRITRLVDNTDISLLPSINPDGFDRAVEGKCSGTGKEAGMYSEGGVDLNRDFPTYAEYVRFLEDYSYDPYIGRQTETKALMQWIVDEPWVLGAGLHDGAVMVTYPWDRPSSPSGQEHTTADKDLFLHLANGYVNTHPELANSSCYRSVEGGVVNGALWNNRNRRGAVGGSMKDFSYMFSNCLEIDLELSCCKYPRPYFLLREWEHNRESLIGLLEQVQMGIKGLVFNERGVPQGNVDIITWRPDGSRWGKNVTTGSRGEYWRVLLPDTAGKNTYTVQAVYGDCEEGGSGRVFASLRHKVIVSNKNPLREQHMYLTQVGFCGISEKPKDTVSVIQNLLQEQERPRGAVTNPTRRKSVSEKKSGRVTVSNSEQLFEKFLFENGLASLQSLPGGRTPSNRINSQDTSRISADTRIQSSGGRGTSSNGRGGFTGVRGTSSDRREGVSDNRRDFSSSRSPTSGPAPARQDFSPAQQLIGDFFVVSDDDTNFLGNSESDFTGFEGDKSESARSSGSEKKSSFTSDNNNDRVRFSFVGENDSVEKPRSGVRNIDRKNSGPRRKFVSVNSQEVFLQLPAGATRSVVKDRPEIALRQRPGELSVLDGL